MDGDIENDKIKEKRSLKKIIKPLLMIKSC